MSKKNAESSNQNNSFDEQNEKAKADTLKRRKDISVIIKDQHIRERLESQLEWNGVFLAGLSGLKEIDVLYLIGACSESDRFQYQSYEKKYALEKGSSFIGLHTYDKLTGKEIELPNVGIKAAFKIDYNSYEDVISYAENFGVFFDISKENSLFAKEIKRTSFLFEILKTNVHHLFLPIEDEMSFCNWYDKTSYEESEYKILQNLICLYNSLRIDDPETEAFLNAMVYLRLKAHSTMLYEMAKDKEQTALDESLRMKHTAEFLSHLIPPELNLDSDERFVLLYESIQKMKQTIHKHPNAYLADYVSKWLEAGIRGFEDNVPANFKRLKFELDITALNSSFFLKEKEILFEKKEEQLAFEEDTKLLSLNEKIFDVIDKQMKKANEDRQKIWQYEMSRMPVSLHSMYKLSQLGDVYTFFALGVIDEKDLTVLEKKTDFTFSKKAFEILDDFYYRYLENQDEVPEEILQGRRLYELSKKNNTFTSTQIVSFLELTGMEGDEINQLVPSSKDVLTDLLKENFDKHISLALKFQKEYFNLIENFRDLSAYITDRALGVNQFSLDVRLPLEKCRNEQNPEATNLNRLMLMGDILDEVYGAYPKSKILISARKKIEKLAAAYYHLTLQKIMNHIDEDKQKEQASRMKQLIPIYQDYLSENDALKTEKETMAYLVKVTKYAMKRFTNVKADQKYYMNWFDFVMDFSSDEKKELDGFKFSLPQYRKNQYTDDSLSFSEQRHFLNELYKERYHAIDREASHYDKRISFGNCSDVDFLYGMGVLSPFEYDTMTQKKKELEIAYQTDQSVFDIWKSLCEETPQFEIQIPKDVFVVMNQIQMAAELIDYRYDFPAISFAPYNYRKKEPTVTIGDFEKNPLMAEGKMLDSLLLMMKDFKEFMPQGTNLTRKILDSYWKESVQQLNALALKIEKKYPEMAKRILDHRGVFGVKNHEKIETVSDRLRYYPKLFSSLLKLFEKEYISVSTMGLKRKCFEKEVSAFVSYYQKRAPILKNFIDKSRERE